MPPGRGGRGSRSGPAVGRAWIEGPGPRMRRSDDPRPMSEDSLERRPMSLWHLQIDPAPGESDREGRRVAAEATELGLAGPWAVRASRGFLIEGQLSAEDVRRAGETLLADPVVER